MASTNKTPNYNLSQFIATDKPAWLTDVNGDMSKIDTAIKNVSDRVGVNETAITEAEANIEDNASNITTLQASSSQHGTDITDLKAQDIIIKNDITNLGTRVTALESGNYIVEEGNSGNWYYRKWNNGVAECWGKFTEIVQVSSWGNVYSANLSNELFPTNLFIETPYLLFNATCLGFDFVSSQGSTSTTAVNTGTAIAIRATAASGDKTFTKTYYAMGKWK